jgi:hypothetical protein
VYVKLVNGRILGCNIGIIVTLSWSQASLFNYLSNVENVV